MEVPEFVKEKIKELATILKIDLDTLLSEYEKIYEYTTTDEQFNSDEDRHKYAVKVLTVKSLAFPEERRYVVIPYGIRDIQVWDNVERSRIYMLVYDGDTYTNEVMMCKGQQAKLVEEVDLFRGYEIRASKTKNYMVATRNTVFNDGKEVDWRKVLDEAGVKIVEQADLVPSGKDGKYVNEFDMYGIDGIVIFTKTGIRNDGTEWGNIKISDGSLLKDQIDEGYVIPAKMNVWIPARFAREVKEGDEVVVYGNTLVDNDDVMYMNAFGLVKVYEKKF